MKVVRSLIGVLLVAVVGLIAAFVLVTSDLSATNTQQASAIRDLKVQVKKAQDRAQTAEVKADTARQSGINALRKDVDAAKEDIDTLQTRGKVIDRKMTSVMDCLPEMQTEMNSIDVDRYGILSMTAQVSRPCQKLVYPDASAD